MSRLLTPRFSVLCLSSCLMGPFASASDTALISHSGMASQGVLSVNVSAGDGNAAANLRAISVNPDGIAAAVVHGGVVQGANAPPGSGLQQARIEGPAFSGFNGVLGINQQAGQGNASANLLGIAQGATGMVSTSYSVSYADDHALAGNVAAPLETVASLLGTEQYTHIDPAAFQGGRGVVQINQVAGNGNISANSLAVQFSRPPGS